MEKDEGPLRERLSSRLRYAWRLAMPFWLFRDAGRGSAEQRIANYRYNRSRRNLLPFYLWKWIGIAICLLNIMELLSSLMTSGTNAGAGHLFITLFCMGAGIGFAVSCAVVSVLLTTYLYLSCVKR